MTSAANFGGLPAEYADERTARIVILPVPYDGTCTWLRGARDGPRALLAASAHMELYDIRTDSEVYRLGIHTAAPVRCRGCSPEQVVRRVEARTRRHVARNKFVVVLGGEHSVSVGAVKAQRAAHPDLSVLQLDAHADLREEYEGSRFNHACAMARIRELCPVVQAGIRSMSVEESRALDRSRMFLADEVAGRRGWVQRAVSRLSRSVYVTVDLDVLDPSVLPSTGTPEPGGLGWREVMSLLEATARRRTIVGFDVVELCPAPGREASDFAASVLVYRLLSCVFGAEARPPRLSRRRTGA